MTLHKIGEKHKTDKAITHFYCDNYEKYLSGLRDKEFVMWEIGVAGGASMKMWREFFPNAKVYGIDNNPDCAGEGIFIGDQADEKFLGETLEKTGAPLIVVDDSSHVGDLTIKTFEYLFPRISDGGLYFIEDCSTFYSKTYSGEFEANGRSKVFNFFSGLAYDVDVAGRGMTGDFIYALETDNPTFDPVPKYSTILSSMHIHCGLWLFKRR